MRQVGASIPSIIITFLTETHDHIQETNAQRDEELRGSRHTNKGTKVSSLCQRVR